MDVDLAPQPTRRQRILRIVRGNGGARRLNLSEILALINLALIAPASISYLMSADQRDKERQYQAWQVLALGTGRQESGGRIHALQDLASNGVPIRGINLNAAYLRELRIPGADLKGALGDHVDLSGADLRRAIFARAVFNRVNFNRANLNRADLTFAALEGTDFTEASACGALFIGGVLRNADFTGAHLDGARFDGADLRGATFDGDFPPMANFQDANIAGLRARTAFIETARLRGAIEIPDDSVWSQLTTSIEGRLKAEWIIAEDVRLTARASMPGCKTLPLERSP